MKIDDAMNDVVSYTTKRFEQLKKDVGEFDVSIPAMSVSFRPEMRVLNKPLPIPEVERGFYQDHLESISAEVIYVNHTTDIVQMEFHVKGEAVVNKNFAHMSIKLFVLMFKKAVLDPLA